MNRLKCFTPSRSFVLFTHNGKSIVLRFDWKLTVTLSRCSDIWYESSKQAIETIFPQISSVLEIFWVDMRFLCLDISYEHWDQQKCWRSGCFMFPVHAIPVLFSDRVAGFLLVKGTSKGTVTLSGSSLAPRYAQCWQVDWCESCVVETQHILRG